MPPGGARSAGAQDDENVETVRRMVDALNAGDLDAMMSYYTDDMVVDVTRIMEGTIEGKASYRDYLQAYIESVDIDYTNVGYLSDGDRVAALADVVGSGSASGIPVHGRFAFLHELRDGLICRTEMHPDVEELLRSLGLDS